MRERFQNGQQLLEICLHGIEYPYDLEVLSQSLLPFIDVGFTFDGINQCHTGLPGPTQNLHFCFVISPIGSRAIDDIEDGCAFHDWGQQFYLFREFSLTVRVVYESPHRLSPLTPLLSPAPQVMESLTTARGPKLGELMPKIYDTMVRMNDEDIRKEYITQMEIILNDDPKISEKMKGIAEGLSIKLGEMMDQPRHQRILRRRHLATAERAAR